MSKVVSPGNALFSLMGFTGLYFLLGLLYLFLIGRELARGPAITGSAASEVPHA